MQDIAENYYKKRLVEFESNLKKVKKTIFYFYLLRLFLFIICIAFLVFFIKYSYEYIFLIASITSFISLLFIVKLNLKFSHKEVFISNRILINKNELKYLKHQYEAHETGEEYCNLNPHLAADFDILGKGSLYQYLNRSLTKAGKTKFAEDLCKSQLNADVIRSKQKAIEELSGIIDFIQIFRAKAMTVNENGNELINLQLWINESTKKIKLLKFLSVIFPLILFVWIIMIFCNIITYQSLILPVLINLFIIYLNLKTTNNAHAKLGKTAQILNKYASIIKLIEEEDFKSPYLTDLKKQLQYKDIKASTSLQSLFRLLNAFDFRFNVVVGFVLNALLLFDIQVLCRLEKWKEKHKSILSLWFSTLAEIDSMLGFATFAFNNQDNVCYPEIVEDEFVFDATDIGHPLLLPEIRINNSLYFSGNPSVIIITGANMAGKSTFIRTLSVNMILAMNGAPVCASKLIFTPSDIMSSIKIQDSLYNNESYFYAELIRLKEIMNHANTNPRTIIFLDEILRGTNTKDKQTGSLGLLENLISQNAIVVIATHDLVIGELEKKFPGIVANYCFEVELTNDQLIFDYKLKNGITNKLNASFLMKKMGIIQ
jgi:hypothetical protein